MLYDMIYTMSDFSAMIDTNYVLVTNCYIFPVYIIFWWNTLSKYQTRNELLPHHMWCW